MWTEFFVAILAAVGLVAVNISQNEDDEECSSNWWYLVVTICSVVIILVSVFPKGEIFAMNKGIGFPVMISLFLVLAASVMNIIGMSQTLPSGGSQEIFIGTQGFIIIACLASIFLGLKIPAVGGGVGVGVAAK